MPEQTATSVPNQSSGGGIDLSDLRVRTLQQAKSELPDPAKHDFLAEEPTLTDPNSLTGEAKKLAGSVDSALSEKVFKPFRQGLNNMGSDLQEAAETGHTRTGGQLTGPARALAGAAGTALKWVPVGENLSDTAAMSVVPPELGPEGKALSKEIKASQKFTKYTKAQMLDAGADGYLDSAVKAHLPLDMIEGHEPTPAMEGGYKKGTPITQPIEVRRNPQSGKYTLYSGNHRVEQAKVNEQTSIPAFIEGATKQDLESFAEVPKVDLGGLRVRPVENPAPQAKSWQIHDLNKDHSIPSEPGYLYHATNSERAHDIAESGLDVHKPSYGTDQEVWPDGTTEKRSYFTNKADSAWQFSPEDGKPALLRTKQDPAIHRQESGTGDFYAKKQIPAKKIEVLGDDGQWHPISELSETHKPSIYTSEGAQPLAEKLGASYLKNPWAESMREQPVYKNNPDHFSKQYGDGNSWYHGTTADFEDFKHEGISRATSDWNSLLGTHFSSQHGVAESFAEGLYSGKSSGGRVIESKLKIKNPVVYDLEGDMGDAALKVAREKGLVTDQEIKKVIRDYDPNSTFHEGNSVLLSLGEKKKAAIAKAFKTSLQQKGHDGIVYGNSVEGHFGNKAAIAFDPSQIEKVKPKDAPNLEGLRIRNVKRQDE